MGAKVKMKVFDIYKSQDENVRTEVLKNKLIKLIKSSDNLHK